MYRKNTKIIFNEDEEHCIGIILMLNPGSCKPTSGDESITKNPKEMICQEDTTQQNVIEIIQEAYNHRLQGYISIVNLSDRREPKQENLLKEFFNKNSNKIIKEIEDNIQKNNKITWVWIAFGKDTKVKDKASKEHIIELRGEVLNEANKLFKGRIIGQNVSYKHPFQRGEIKYSAYKDEIVKEIRLKSNSQ